MKILITGGSGFLGLQLAKKLIKKKHKIIILDNRKLKLRNKNCHLIKGNIKNSKLLNKIMKRVDVVYHFAGISDIEYSILNPMETIETNIYGTFRILKACVENNVKKIVFGSSVYVQSSQGSFYRITKQTCELLLQEFKKRYNLDFVILRFGSVYGIGANKNNGLIKIIDRYFQNKNFLQYDGSHLAQRKFIHVNDVINACIHILNKKFENTIVMVTGKKYLKIKKVMKIISSILQIKKPLIFNNEKQNGHYILSPNKTKNIKLLNFKIKKEYNFKLGIKELIEFLRKKY